MNQNYIKIDKKSYKNILIYYFGNDSTDLYLIFYKENECFEEINGNKNLTLVPTNESKENIKKYEELWSKIRDLFRSITIN